MRLRFDTYEVDVSERILRCDGVRIEVQDKTFDLLVTLLGTPRTLVTREAIDAALWPGVAVTDQSLRQVVRRLRQALSDEDGQLLENVRGRGYRLHVDVRVQGRAQATVPTRGGRFVGRTLELDALHTALAQPGVHTLLGPGGVGKSRLAAEGVRDCTVPVWFCALNDATGLDAALSAVAHALGTDLGEPDPVGGLGRALAYVGRGILVLDGVEAIADAIAPAVAAWSAAAPHATILVTSREPLRIDGEQRAIVPPLGDAVELLQDRARLVAAGPVPPELADRIVSRLDGLPLAIELAAARLAAMGPAELADRLDDRFELLNHPSRTAPARHATLSTVFGWSWDLLDRAERDTLGAAAVFRGSFDRAAAEHVLGPPTDDRLLALVERSWLQVERTDDGTVRYRMLRTARAFVADRDPGALEDARLRHARYHAALWRNPHHRLLPSELEDLLATLEVGLERRDRALVVGGALPVIDLWGRAGPHAAAVALVERALATLPDEPWLLARSARLLGRVGRSEDALAQAERAVDAARRIEDLEAEREAWYQVGTASLGVESLGQATQAYRTGLELAAAVGDRASEVLHLAALARTAALARRHDEAAELLRRTLALAQTTDVLDARSTALYVAGEVHYRAGRLAEAEQAIAQTVAFAVGRGDLRMEGIACADLGVLMRRSGRLDAAAIHQERASTIMHQIGDRIGIRTLQYNLAPVRIQQGRRDKGRELLLASLAGARESGDRFLLPRTLIHLVELYPSSWSDEEAAAMREEARAINADPDLVVQARALLA